MPEMSKEQRNAVDFHDGALLLLAGPGSGKTFVITHRIKALIDSGVDASSILVITFTKAAALQMKDRFLNLVSPHMPSVSFGTFHAIFYSILKNHNSYRSVVPITDKEKLNMLKRALEIAGCECFCSDFDDYNRTLSLISACKNNGNAPNDFIQDMYSKEDFKKVFDSYQLLLHEFGKIDFDDMICDCLLLLQSDEKTRRYWQDKYKYILIDEFQDISGTQYELIKILASPENNIFVVGDDDQSIYRFRGARVELMHSFLRDYPNAKKDLLSTNYRSTGNIVAAAKKVIQDNIDRFSKNIIADRDLGEPICLIKHSSQLSQYSCIVRTINDLIDSGKNINEIAILVRTNRQGAEYAALLRTNNIPTCFNSLDRPFSSLYIRDICAYMALANGELSRENMLRIMNKPLRYIRRAAITKDNFTEKELLDFYSSDSHMRLRIMELFDHIRRIRTMRPKLAIRYICNTIGYSSWVKENVTVEKYSDYKLDISAFETLVNDLYSYDEVKEKIEQIQGVNDEKQQNNITAGVRIQTFHSSKGLEYEYVIIPDVNEGKMPSKTSRSREEIEEERRMFYVAITRAKDRLFMFYRDDDGLKPSRFISKII